MNGLDQGDVRAAIGCFTFSHRFEGTVATIYSSEFRLFESLYSHRLTGTYSVCDLFADDAAVRTQFRDYVLTRKLKMNLTDGDAEALVKHLQAIAEAMYAGQKFELVDGYTVDGGKLISDGLSLKGDEGPPVPEPTIDPNDYTLCVHKWVLDCLPDSILINCLMNSGLYWSVNQAPYADPDFDCDDFAWMAMNWLRRTLLVAYPNAQVTLMPISYRCGTSLGGHAILRIVVGNKGWYYDPESGTWRGPYTAPISPEQEEAIIRALLTGLVCPGNTGPEDLHVIPRAFPRPWEWFPPKYPEAPPFDQPHLIPSLVFPNCNADPLMPDPRLAAWERFRQKLEQCCQTLTHPAPMPSPINTTGPCPTIPAGTVWPDLCNPENYTHPIIP